MRSKPFVACLALVAFAAFAVPSLASAANSPLVVENGTALATGTQIEGVNEGVFRWTTSMGTFECTTAIMTGTLIKNLTGTVEETVTSFKAGGTGSTQSGAEEPECTTAAIFGGDTTFTGSTATNGLPWCLRATSTMVEGEFQLRGNECAKASRPIRIAYDITNVGTCTYERSSAFSGRYTTSTTSSTITISEAEVPGLAGNPFGCWGTLKFDFSLGLRTDGGGATLGISS